MVSSVRADIIPADRRVVWQAGVPGGVPIRTNIFCDVTVHIPGSSRVAAGDGLHNDYDALIDAIRLCPQEQVVHLPAGTYQISRPLFLANKSQITLRGDGPESTIIQGALTNGGAALIILGSGEWAPPANRTADILSGYVKGSTNIVLASVPVALSTSALLVIDQLNDGTMVTSTGVGGLCNFADRLHNGTRNVSQTVKVTGVNGTSVTFWPPLNWTYSASLSPQATTLVNYVQHTGLEDFKVLNTTNKGNDNIDISSAYQCWVKNIESDKVVAHHLLMYQTLQCEIRDSFFHDAFNYTVGAGYGVDVRVSTDVLIENNLFHHLYATLIVSAGSSGCVVGYNYIHQTFNTDSTYMMTGISASHSAYPTMNLFEGNIANEFQADFHWGSSGSLTVFRNYFAGTDIGILNNRKAISLDSHSLSNNVVGNVLGSPGIKWNYDAPVPGFTPSFNAIYRLGFPNIGNDLFSTATNNPGVADVDLRVSATLLRHGNYDYATKSTTWDSKLADRALPSSLYLADKPGWWGTNRWPAIGPDLDPMVGTIPAQNRFSAMNTGPRNLRIIR